LYGQKAVSHIFGVFHRRKYVTTETQIKIMRQLLDEADCRTAAAVPSRTRDTPTVIDKPIPYRLS